MAALHALILADGRRYLAEQELLAGLDTLANKLASELHK